MEMAKSLLILFALFLIVAATSPQALTQGGRLVDIKTAYIVPNEEEKENRQFQDKIPEQLGWTVTSRRSEAEVVAVPYSRTESIDYTNARLEQKLPQPQSR